MKLLSVRNLSIVLTLVAVVALAGAVLAGTRIVLKRDRSAVSGEESFSPVEGDSVDFPTQGVEYEKPAGPENQLLPDGAPFGDLLPESGDNGMDLLSKISFLDAGHHAGVDTIGSTLKNASHDLRRSPPNPKRNVSPWQMSTAEPDPFRRALDM